MYNCFVFLEDVDQTLNEYDYGSMNVPSRNTCEDYISISKQENENFSNSSASSIHSK